MAAFDVPYIDIPALNGFSGVLALINFLGLIWMFIDLLKTHNKGIETLIWALVIIFVPFGWVLYYILEKR
jgi:hypothetical protein